MKRGMPQVQVRPDAAALGSGMDLAVAQMFAKPGTPRLAYNYECAVKGGIERLRGIEPFDGRPSPSAATFVMLQCTATIAGISLGDTVVGGTSAATGVVIYLSADTIAMTRTTGTFASGEDLKVGGVTKAVVLSVTPTIDGFVDNTVSKLAADNYQADITKVPGEGAIRGLAALNSVVYAWRNNVGSTAMAIYKSTSGGWVLVPMYHQISFTLGTAAYAEGSTLSQGGVTATVKRVVLESGTWAGGTAAGRMIITTPSGGSFAAGAAAGGGACTLSAASALIVLAISGHVQSDVYSFTASLATKRLYGCDGVNPEFEFDGDVLAPLSTGMGSIRATSVRCHKNHLFFGYRGSLQYSAIGNPYIWSAVFGAAELSTGDDITCLVSVGGATDAAALMVLCQNAIAVLYGTSSANFQLLPQSRIAGAQARSAQDIGGVVALDTPGVVRYPATRSFGNFAWDTVSMQVQDIARNQTCACSVFVSGLFKYRIFFADGTALSGLPTPTNGGGMAYHWSVINYGRAILFAEHAEINGVARTFYADGDGWVYEADVGRSFAGDPIQTAIKLLPLAQRSPGVDKTYWQMQMEMKASSACTLYTSGEFGGNETDGATEQTATPQYGAGLAYDLANFDQSYWDVAAVSRKTVPMEGEGTSVAPTITGLSDNELTHTIYAITLLYTPRRLVR